MGHLAEGGAGGVNIGDVTARTLTRWLTRLRLVMLKMADVEYDLWRFHEPLPFEML